MTNKIKIILIVAACIVFATIIIYMQIFIKINIEEYKIEEIVYKDIENDGEQEKIQISSITLNNNAPSSDIFYMSDEINICINDNNYKFKTNQGERTIKWAIADLNADGRFEILVCVCDESISPSYRQWNIYKYSDNNLRFV